MYLVFVLLCCTQSKCAPGDFQSSCPCCSYPFFLSLKWKYHFLRLHVGFKHMPDAHLHLLKSGFSAASLQRKVEPFPVGKLSCSQTASWLLTWTQGCQDHLENTSRSHFCGFLTPFCPHFLRGVCPKAELGLPQMCSADRTSSKQLEPQLPTNCIKSATPLCWPKLTEVDFLAF